MIEPIEKLYQMALKPGATVQPAAQKPALKGNPVNSGDVVDYSTEGLLQTFRGQAQTLKQDLPQLISSAVLDPVKSDAIKSAPLNALVFRLTDPLQNLLGHVPKEAMTPEQLDAFQQEVSKFRNELLALKDHSLLSPLTQSAATAGTLDGILNSLAHRLDSTITALESKAASAG
jgi:hypothetical protein